MLFNQSEAAPNSRNMWNSFSGIKKKMAWSKSISLDVANKIFSAISVSFKVGGTEGGYIAIHSGKTLRRTTLTACCIAVLSDWVAIKEDLNTDNNGI
ncbi:hypothetical protein VB735_15150 [Halotia wernerae UHCC 0503]|nr:hypothetical protein [Halotia wernerae UHCC 0503]